MAALRCLFKEDSLLTESIERGTMWGLYDALIDGVCREAVVTDALVGSIWTAVRTRDGVGLAMTTQEDTRTRTVLGDLRGMKLIDLAASVKSWNFIEASLGMAALNAHYNRPNMVAESVLYPNAPQEQDAFIASYDEIKGKRVCVVGHFPFLENGIRDICDLAVLERQPKEGDYPDPACEYLLPEADFVFITGSALINKTLPRLLTLSKRAKTTLVGTSVPLASALFDFDVDCLAGYLPVDHNRCWRIAAYEHTSRLSAAGRRVRLPKPAKGKTDERR
jgi:uncharacterized protein (DUF4213/DUF364 family)